MENHNAKLLEEIYKANKMGVEAAEILMPKIRDDELREKVGRQAKNYKGMANKAREMLRQDGWTPDEKTGIKKMMLWGSVQMNTLMNTSTPVSYTHLRGSASPSPLPQDDAPWDSVFPP